MKPTTLTALATAKLGEDPRDVVARYLGSKPVAATPAPAAEAASVVVEAKPAKAKPVAPVAQEEFALVGEATASSEQQVEASRLRLSQECLLGAASANPRLLTNPEWQTALASVNKLIKPS